MPEEKSGEGGIVQELKDTQTFKALDALFGDLFDIPGQRVKIWRLRNLRAVAEKAKKLGLSAGDPIPMKAQLALASAVSEEDDPDLQDLWARIIVNTLAGVEIDTFLIDTVRKLSRSDVLLIEYLRAPPIEKFPLPPRHRINEDRKDASRRSKESALREISSALGMSADDISLSVARLLALGLTKEPVLPMNSLPCQLSQLGQILAKLTSRPVR